jgi:hypothetical protein
MSQTVVPAPATYGPDYYGPAPTGPLAPRPNRLAAAASALRQSFSGSPGRLRLIAVGAVVSVVLSALLGAWALQLRSSALDRAASSSAHLLLLQNVQTKLAQADADATNAFLGSGLEPQAPRLDYIASLAEASRDLGIAAQHSEADAEALGAANAALTRYAGYVASARANNRQNLPVGASYLNAASDLLKSKVLSPLQERSRADSDAVSSAFSRAANVRWLLLLAAVIGVGGLLYAQILLTRRSHRYVNLPVAASTIVLVVVLAASAVVMSAAQSEASDVREGPLAKATGLSASRVSAFDAKSEESLTLIARGSATEADTDWKGQYQNALDQLDGAAYPEAKTALQKYGAAHTKLNTQDLSGDWDGAVKAAISTKDGSINALFTQYADLTGKSLTTQATATADRLASADDRLLPFGLLLLIVGLLCAAGAWWGVSLRLDEYR